MFDVMQDVVKKREIQNRTGEFGVIGNRQVRFDVLDALFGGALGDVGEQRAVNVDGDCFAGRPDSLGERSRKDAGAGADVGNHHAGFKAEQLNNLIDLQAGDALGVLQMRNRLSSGSRANLECKSWQGSTQRGKHCQQEIVQGAAKVHLKLSHCGRFKSEPCGPGPVIFCAHYTRTLRSNIIGEAGELSMPRDRKRINGAGRALVATTALTTCVFAQTPPAAQQPESLKVVDLLFEDYEGWPR